MNLRKLTNEHLLYLLAFVLAVGVRFLFLGLHPLSDAEASWAVQALSITRGESPQIGPQAGSVLLSTLMFFMFGAGNLVARFWPALLGSLLVVAPYCFRQSLGKRAALILTFALAFDPGLTAISKQLGSPILAVAAVLLALGCHKMKWYPAAGIFAGLALLGGTQLWPGLIALAVTWLVVRAFKLNTSVETPIEDGSDRSDEVASDSRRGLRIAGIYALGTLLVIGTLFFRTPQGLSAAADSMVTYLRGWGTATGESLSMMAAGLGAYELLPLIFGLWAIVYAWIKRDTVGRILSIWFVAALLTALVYPSRQVSDLAWAIVPLWGLAAMALDRLPDADPTQKLWTWGYAAVILALIGFTVLNFTGLLVDWQASSENQQARGLAFTGGMVLILLITALVGWGWSSKIAGIGLLRGSIAALCIFTISACMHAAGIPAKPTAELWGSYPRPDDGSFLLETIGDYSQWHTGDRGSIDLDVVGSPSASLVWELRNIPQAHFVSQLATGSQPSMVLTMNEQQPALTATYRGQSFVWDASPDWGSLDVFGRLEWLSFHTAPEQKSNLVLWVRTDLFMGDTTGSSTLPVQTP